MIVDLTTQEMKAVFDGSHFICDVGSILKKAAEGGGLAFCIASNRAGFIGVRNIEDPDVRQAATRGLCAAVITGCVELTSHLSEWMTGVDCRGCQPCICGNGTNTN